MAAVNSVRLAKKTREALKILLLYCTYFIFKAAASIGEIF